MEHEPVAVEAARTPRDISDAPAELMRMAADRDPEVRATAAAHRDCPIAALTALSHDPSDQVLHALLTNPRTPSSVIRRLADHKDERIADAAVQRLRNSFR